MKHNQNGKLKKIDLSTMVAEVDVGSELHYDRAFDYRSVELSGILKISNDAVDMTFLRYNRNREHIIRFLSMYLGESLLLQYSKNISSSDFKDGSTCFYTKEAVNHIDMISRQVLIRFSSETVCSKVSSQLLFPCIYVFSSHFLSNWTYMDAFITSHTFFTIYYRVIKPLFIFLHLDGILRAYTIAS